MLSNSNWTIKDEKMGVWRCGNRLDGMKCLKSPSYHEDVLQKNILKAINGMIGNTENVESAVVSSAEKMKAENELIDTEISEIVAKLTEIEETRDSILECVSGSMFEQMSSELKKLNAEENGLVEKMDALKAKKENNRRSILKAGSATELFRDISPLIEFDENTVDKLIQKIEAVNKDEIAVIFCGGFRIVQTIEK